MLYPLPKAFRALQKICDHFGICSLVIYLFPCMDVSTKISFNFQLQNTFIGLCFNIAIFHYFFFYNSSAVSWCNEQSHFFRPRKFFLFFFDFYLSSVFPFHPPRISPGSVLFYLITFFFVVCLSFLWILKECLEIFFSLSHPDFWMHAVQYRSHWPPCGYLNLNLN